MNIAATLIGTLIGSFIGITLAHFVIIPLLQRTRWWPK